MTQNKKTACETEKTFEFIFENIRDGIVLVDAGTKKISMANSAIGRMLGYTKKELCSISIFDVHPEDSRPHIEKSFKQLLNKEIELAKDIPVLTKDGEVFYADIAATPMQYNGKPHLLATFRNISERKQAEEKFKQLASLHQTILDTVTVGLIYIKDRKTQWTNSFITKMFGYEYAELIGKDASLYYGSEEIYNKVGREGYVQLAKGEIYSIELQGKRKDGSLFWCNLVGRAINPHNLAEGSIWVAQDINERKEAEEALKNSEALLRSLFEASSAGIGLLSDRKFLKVNNSLCRITGYSEEELLGQLTQHLYVDEEEYNRLRQLYKEVEQNGLGMAEARLRRKDGSEINALICLSPVNPNDLKGSYIATVLDITERKKMEAEKLRLEEMLLHSQKMEAIGTMAGGIAHDFNNILSGIFGYSELSLTVDGNPPETDRYIRELLKAAERARDLIRQILTFSRQTEPALKPIMPKYIIKEALKLLHASTPKEVDLKAAIKSESAIMADPTLLHQMILNLCNNAIHAMQSRPGVVEISLEDIEVDQDFARLHPGIDPGKHILLRVSDTGSGIAPAILDHIFEPFFTTKMKGEGTGLGLSVVHGIVKKLNGIITVSSEIGKGTVFTIIMPAINETKIEIDRSDSIITGGKEKILLVDDEEAIIKTLGRILDHLGYKVKAFTDCREALKEFRDNPDEYDVIITDYSMPFMTGLELAGKIKEIRNAVPIILSSGYLNKEMGETVYKTGVCEMLSKPVSTYQLADAIRKAIAGSKTTQTTPNDSVSQDAHPTGHPL